MRIRCNVLTILTHLDFVVLETMIWEFHKSIHEINFVSLKWSSICHILKAIRVVIFLSLYDTVDYWWPIWYIIKPNKGWSFWFGGEIVGKKDLVMRDTCYRMNQLWTFVKKSYWNIVLKCFVTEICNPINTTIYKYVNISNNQGLTTKKR